MVWLAKWIREHVTDPRILVLTDRTELDEQIEGVFFGVDEKIYRTKSCRDLVNQLNTKEKWLMCSLIHKFGWRAEANEEDIEKYVAEMRRDLPAGFEAKGDIFVFVDECHRSHTGKLHEAMQKILPRATFIGFTGTPLLKVDKSNSIAVWDMRPDA
jgi:type I restriction enzyme R subunit